MPNGFLVRIPGCALARASKTGAKLAEALADDDRSAASEEQIGVRELTFVGEKTADETARSVGIHHHIEQSRPEILRHQEALKIVHP